MSRSRSSPASPARHHRTCCNRLVNLVASPMTPPTPFNYRTGMGMQSVKGVVEVLRELIDQKNRGLLDIRS